LRAFAGSGHLSSFQKGYLNIERSPQESTPKGTFKYEQLFKIAIDENMKRNFISYLELALCIKRLQHEKGYTNLMIAKMLGLTLDQVKRYITMIKRATDEVLRALHEGKILLSHVYRLYKLSADEQNNLLKRIIDERLSPERLSQVIESLSNRKANQFIHAIMKNPLENCRIKERWEGRKNYFDLYLRVESLDKLRIIYKKVIQPFFTRKEETKVATR
jgi:ParB-like chromosome segregation protein Spo0J